MLTACSQQHVIEALRQVYQLVPFHSLPSPTTSTFYTYFPTPLCYHHLILHTTHYHPSQPHRMDPDDPGSPGPIIKQEPQDDAGLPQHLKQGEIISLISDDEDETPVTTNVPPLGSPFREPPSKKALPNLGPSLLSKPKTIPPAKGASGAAHKLYREKLLDKAHKGAQETAQRFRNDSQQAKRTRPRTPAEPASDGIFVTDSRPGTPDAAEVFAALQQDIANKRRRGTLSFEDDIRYRRAKDAEMARISKQDSDRAYDMSHEIDEEDDDTEENLDLARLSGLMEDPSDDQTVPKKRGVKRKTPTTSKPPKKRGKAAKDLDTEDLLNEARRKETAKRAGKGKGKATAAKNGGASKGGRKPKPAGPNLLNTTGMLGNSSIIEDAARSRDLPNQPTFYPTGRKNEALTSLIASVPEEYRPIAKADKKYLEDATKEFTGHGVVKPAGDGSTWSVKGMKVTLKNYQVLGVAFMRKRENSTQQPRGGILADTMGLGKTIMMLTNIVNGKSLQKSNCRTTLIVASAALVSQWRQEIADKVCTTKEDKHGIGRVKEYHASAQIRGNQEIEELEDCDIVLTTYTQVQKSYPKAEPPEEYTDSKQKDAWWDKYYEEHKGVLHRIKWHRVVLDEAQAIKNHKSLTSMACRALEGKHHWAMSGTPILNRIEEFYSIFKFIREPHTGTLALFRSNFCSPNDPNGLEKLDVFLRKFMIRRTHLDKFFNARLLDLPTPNRKVMWLDFNDIERSVYEIVKSRFVTRINSFSKAGDFDKKYKYVTLPRPLLFCLRLRLHFSVILIYW
jgi:SNF2 family DNA or RNA helicase